MKKIVFALIGCVFLSLPTFCFGATGWYGSVNAGVAIVPDGGLDVSIPGLISGSVDLSYDTGYTVGGAVGYMLDPLRFEGEVSYQANDMDSVSGPGGSVTVDGDVSALTFLVNGYYDFVTSSRMTPYITAGIGYSKVDAEIEGESEDDNLFTYQLGVGIGYAFNEKLLLDIRYRYLGFEDFEYSDAYGSLSAEVSSHNITAGLRFAF